MAFTTILFIGTIGTLVLKVASFHQPVVQASTVVTSVVPGIITVERALPLRTFRQSLICNGGGSKPDTNRLQDEAEFDLQWGKDRNRIQTDYRMEQSLICNGGGSKPDTNRLQDGAEFDLQWGRIETGYKQTTGWSKV